MILQPITSEFPYIWENFFLFASVYFSISEFLCKSHPLHSDLLEPVKKNGPEEQLWLWYTLVFYV